jgi:hypothetical protein
MVPTVDPAVLPGSPCDVAPDCGYDTTADGVADTLGVCLTEAYGFPQGYCSEDCDANPTCSGNGRCLLEGFCAYFCETDTCRDDGGYDCVGREPGGAWPGLCLPDATGALAVGDPCSEADPCPDADGRCITEPSGWLGGYCVIEECSTNMGPTAAPTAPNDTCPVESHCAFEEVAAGIPGTCLLTCDSGVDLLAADDCPVGYACENRDGVGLYECVPSEQPCASDHHCGPSLPVCSDDGLCTECAGNADCERFPTKPICHTGMCTLPP